jgi:mannose-6-phosphate isomerase-like protein (cupin superfamily)
MESAKQGQREVGRERDATRARPHYEMPDGSVYEIVTSADETDGQRTEMISTLPNGNVSPPPHVHPQQINTFEVLEGTVELMVDGRWRTFHAGERATVPAGTLHTFRNRSGAPVRILDTHEPALRFEDYLEHIHKLMKSRGLKRGNDPRVAIYLSMVTLEYPDIVRSTRLRDRVLLKALAVGGRLLRMNTRITDETG